MLRVVLLDDSFTVLVYLWLEVVGLCFGHFGGQVLFVACLNARGERLRIGDELGLETALLILDFLQMTLFLFNGFISFALELTHADIPRFKSFDQLP